MRRVARASPRVSAVKDDGVPSPPDAPATGSPDASVAGTDASVDAPPTSTASCSANGTVVAIAANHGHVLVVSKADVAAGTQKMYSIQGGSQHDHTVTVTAAQFAMLAANTSVSTVSSATGHTHSITVSCAMA